MREFKLWKAQLMNYLIKIQKDDPKFKEQKMMMISKLDNLRSRWISSFLADLYRFADYWNIDITKYLPSDEEIKLWIQTLQ